LKSLPFITRIPHTLKVVGQVIAQALALDTWQDVDVQTRYQRLALCHYGMAQRWRVVFSQAAAWRAETTVDRAQHQEYAAIQQQLFHLQAQRFASQTAAHEALTKLCKKWRYHHWDVYAFTAHKRYDKKGRPTPDTPIKATEWQIDAQVKPDAGRIKQAKQLGSC
jgi:hypothetical protein